MKVNEGLKSTYANKWIRAIDLESKSLNDFKCFVPEKLPMIGIMTAYMPLLT
jgi:hypothetical protein